MNAEHALFASARVGGRYRLERSIDKAGVYPAFDEELQRNVEVHVARARGMTHRERFLRAALASSQRAHPNVVGVLDFGVDVTLRALFMIVERVGGRALRDDVEAHGAMPWPRAVFVLRQLAAAVATSHNEGDEHAQFVADVRASSVRLCDVEGIRDFVKVHIAPARRIDPPRDVSALGRIAWRMLVGTAAPVAGVTRRALRVGARVDVPPALDDIICAALDPRASRRPSAVDVFTSLRALMPGR